MPCIAFLKPDLEDDSYCFSCRNLEPFCLCARSSIFEPNPQDLNRSVCISTPPAWPIMIAHHQLPTIEKPST